MTTAVERAQRLAARLRALGVDPGEDGREDAIPYWMAVECPCCGQKQRLRQITAKWDADPKYLAREWDAMEPENGIRLHSLTVTSGGPGKIANHAQPLVDYLADMPRQLRAMNVKVTREFLRRMKNRLHVAASAAHHTESRLVQALDLAGVGAALPSADW